MKKTLILEGLDCANCAAKIERGVGSVKGVKEASVNFITTKLTVDIDDGCSNVEEVLKQIKKNAKKVDSDITVKEL